MIRLRYWQNLLNMNKKRLPKQIYEWEKEKKEDSKSWVSNTKKLLTELYLQDFWIQQKINKTKTEWNKLITEKIQIREQKRWSKRALSKPKLRTYVKYKKILKKEDYLKSEDSIGRRMLARIRSGTNSLRIETGRYERPKLAEEYRICRVCKTETENEEHFLMGCSAYENIRKETIQEMYRENEEEETIKKIFFGIGKEDEIKKVIRYIRRAMSKRRRILEMCK